MKIKNEAPRGALVISKIPLQYYTQKIGLDFVGTGMGKIKKGYDKVFIVYQRCENVDTLKKSGEEPPNILQFSKKISETFG